MLRLEFEDLVRLLRKCDEAEKLYKLQEILSKQLDAIEALDTDEEEDDNEDDDDEDEEEEHIL